MEVRRGFETQVVVAADLGRLGHQAGEVVEAGHAVPYAGGLVHCKLIKIYQELIFSRTSDNGKNQERSHPAYAGGLVHCHVI